MKTIIILTSFFFILTQNICFSAMGDEYYSIPPFLQKNTYSNLYLVLDYSGSMAYPAYNTNEDSYDVNEKYYGYYDQNSNYSCTGDVSIYSYTPPGYGSSFADYIHCNGHWQKDSSGSYSGNELNFRNMARIDLLRYVLTGGGVYQDDYCRSINTCSSYDNENDCENNNLCYWENRWWGNGCYNRDYCNDYTDATTCNLNDLCTWNSEKSIMTEYGEQISYEDISNYDPATQTANGILQEINERSVKPRLGLVIYSSGVTYNIEPSYDYNNIVATINDTVATGGTYTYGGIQAAKEYFESDSAYSFNIDGDMTNVSCTKNFTLLMSDGAWNEGNSNDSPDDVDPQHLIHDMWKGGNADLKLSLKGNQNVQTFSMAMFLDSASDGFKAMKHFGVFGGYKGQAAPCNYTSEYLNTSLTTNFPNSSCEEWDTNSDGLPDNFFSGEDPDKFRTSLEKVFEEILKEVSSGTSVAILNDKRKEGSIMTQAVFYPDYQGVPWIGKLFGYWFLNFKDPQGNTVQNIREDTYDPYKLNICNDNGTPGGDRILEFGYDDLTSTLQVSQYRSDCSGYRYDNTSYKTPYDQLEDINSLYEVSTKIYNSYSSNSYNDRTIYTTCDDDNCIYTQNLTELKNYSTASDFGTDYGCLGSFDNLTDFVYGKNIPGCVDRTDDDGTKRILGDIIYSTPRIANYDNMSIIYVAANDGMLHAFRAGEAVKYHSSDYIAVQLQNAKNDSGISDIGREEWAFIPRNAQPYLRYRAQPDFRHLYINDLTPYIFDYGDKKILIGGMRMGGGVNCNNDNTTCVSPPVDTADNSSVSGGFSSYYALDITDPLSPKYLWEFTDEYLGFAYSGPAVIKRPDGLYVMFLSGMKGYDGELAYEGSNAKVYVLTINPNNFNIEETNSYSVGDIDSNLKKNQVYGNRLFTDGVDLDNDGYTDAVFFAFSYLQADDWTSNLYVARTDDSSFPTSGGFLDRVVSSLHGAVTAGIVYMPCFNMDYIYFGTGRWFYKQDDSAGRTNKLYGINISCLRDNSCNNFSNLVNNDDICSELNHSTTKPAAWEIGLNTEQVVDGVLFGKERIISDAGKMEWADTVLFTSMQPSTDPCAYGGRSRGWGLNCATGKSIWDNSCPGFTVDNSSVTCGYLQTSTTAINQLCAESFSTQEGDRNVSNAMGQGNSTGGDASINDVNAGQTEWYTGITPETPPIIPPPYSGLKGDILLWIEK